MDFSDYLCFFKYPLYVATDYPRGLAKFFKTEESNFISY